MCTLPYLISLKMDAMVHCALFDCSPSVLACLWDVTDKDIDRFTQCLLKSWLDGDDEKVWLSDHVAKARRACRLEHLVGSASVIFGLPINIKH